MSRLKLWIEGIEDAGLSVRRFEVQESVSKPFRVSIVACSARADLDWDETILRPSSFAINAGWAFVENGGQRSYTGVCESFEQVQAEPSGLSTYAIRIAPRLWLLTERENCRIFQHLSIPDIITRILDDYPIAHQWRIDTTSFPKLDYKVQFNESDYALVSRLCEEGGITFTFEHQERRGSILILSDAPCAVAGRGASPLLYVDNPNQAAEMEFVSQVRVMRGARAGSVAIRDYDFRNPTFALVSLASRSSDVESMLEKFRYEPGAFRRRQAGERLRQRSRASGAANDRARLHRRSRSAAAQQATDLPLGSTCDT